MFALSSVFMAALAEPSVPTPMASFLKTLTTAFTSILSCVASAASTIVANPFLLFTVIFLFAGGVIGIMGRILSRN